jgi:small subunit ribosomal protein S6
MSEEDFDALRQTYEQVIQSNGGSVAQSESWGKRRLAYRVRKHLEGYYGFLLFDGTGGLVKELERRYRLNEEVIKFLSVKAPPEGIKVAGHADFKLKRTEGDRVSEAAPESRPETPAAAAPPAAPEGAVAEPVAPEPPAAEPEGSESDRERE